ncbi:hypothetical protein IMZ48_37255 [Candidatus Bathyarchaeota archaeon]|nr:hypothetical protein [Candidatus Bathyarchaeota archaeon]
MDSPAPNMLGPAWKHQPEASHAENWDYNLIRLGRYLEAVNLGQTALLAVHLGLSLYTSKSLSYDSFWTNPTPLLVSAERT